MRQLRMAFLPVALALACAVPAPLAEALGRARPIAGMTTGDWSAEVVTDALSYPWDINRVGNVIVMTEAGGHVVMIEGGRLRRYTAETSDPIVHDGGSALLGMALAEDFQTSGLAYLYHSYRSDSGLTNKVIQARFDGRSWRETRTLLAGIPGHRLYNGGRIAIGPDGHLYEDGVTCGTPTWIWSVEVDGALYARAYNGRNSRWYRAALRQKAGRITAAGMTKEVTFEPADGPINDRVDDAYRTKYRRNPYLGPMTGVRARSATVKVMLREAAA